MLGNTISLNLIVRQNIFQMKNHPNLALLYISELANWATDSQIPVSALAGLLNVLRRYHPSLPKDPRTLLKIPRKTNLREVDDGNGGYYHFGVKESLAKSTQLFDFLSVNRHVDNLSADKY